MLSTQRLRRGQRLAGSSSGSVSEWPLSEMRGEDESSPFSYAALNPSNNETLLPASASRMLTTATIAESDDPSERLGSPLAVLPSPSHRYGDRMDTGEDKRRRRTWPLLKR